MKICTKCSENKSIECFYKDKSTSDGLRWLCIECDKSRRKTYYEKNSKEICSKAKKYYINNSNKIINRIKKYTKDNLEKIYVYRKQWGKNNRGKTRSYNAKRHSQKLKATPKWLTKEHFKQIEEIYIKAVKLTEETGIKYEVDHIIPLQGINVCGLHVPWNLQIITSTENRSKRNKIV